MTAQALAALGNRHVGLAPIQRSQQVIEAEPRTGLDHRLGRNGRADFNRVMVSVNIDLLLDQVSKEWHPDMIR